MSQLPSHNAVLHRHLLSFKEVPAIWIGQVTYKTQIMRKYQTDHKYFRSPENFPSNESKRKGKSSGPKRLLTYGVLYCLNDL